MLNQKDNHCGGQLNDISLDDLAVHLGHSGILETPRHHTQQIKHGVILAVQVDSRTDHGIEQNDKHGAQRRGKEPNLRPVRPPFCAPGAERADNVQHGACGHTHCCIDVGRGQIFERIDDDHVCRVPGAEPRLSEQGLDLARANVQRGACHEGRDGGK